MCTHPFCLSPSFFHHRSQYHFEWEQHLISNILCACIAILKYLSSILTSPTERKLGPDAINMSSHQYRNSLIKTRRSHDRLIFKRKQQYLKRASFDWNGFRNDCATWLMCEVCLNDRHQLIHYVVLQTEYSKVSMYWRKRQGPSQ